MRLQIEIPKKNESLVIPLLKALGVKIISEPKEDDILSGLEQSLKEVKAMREGKIPEVSLEEALGD